MRRRFFTSSLNEYIIKSDCIGGSVAVQEIGGGYKQVGIIPSSGLFEFYDKRDSVSVKINYSTSKKEESTTNSTRIEYTNIQFPSSVNFKIVSACLSGNGIKIGYILRTSGNVLYTEISTPISITTIYGLESPDEKVIMPDVQNTINAKRIKESENSSEGTNVRKQKETSPDNCSWSIRYYYYTNTGEKYSSFGGRPTSLDTVQTVIGTPTNNSHNKEGVAELSLTFKGIASYTDLIINTGIEFVQSC